MKNLRSLRAYEKLKAIGLSEYESLIYLKLILNGPSTAREISESTGIPYTKVYEVLESLAIKGWIEIGQSRPMQFRAKPPSEVIEIIKSEYISRINEIENIFMNELQSIYEARSIEGSDIWFIKSPLAIANRIKGIILASKKELYLIIGYLNAKIYSEILEIISNIDNKLVKIIANKEVSLFFNKLNSIVFIKRGENVIPFNLILSDRGEILFHLVVGLDKPQDEHRNFAVYMFDKSLAKIIYEYFEFLWRSIDYEGTHKRRPNETT